MDLSGFAPLAPVECRWLDIVSESEWQKEEELDAPPIVKTRGFFIGQKTFHTKECVIIAGSIGEDGDISNVDTIPVGTIISLENLGE